MQSTAPFGSCAALSGGGGAGGVARERKAELNILMMVHESLETIHWSLETK